MKIIFYIFNKKEEKFSIFHSELTGKNYSDLKKFILNQTDKEMSKIQRSNNIPLKNKDKYLSILNFIHGDKKENFFMKKLFNFNVKNLSNIELDMLWSINKNYCFKNYPISFLENLIIFVSISNLNHLNNSAFRIFLIKLYREVFFKGLLDYSPGNSKTDFFIENISHLINLYGFKIEYQKIIENLEKVLDELDKENLDRRKI